MHKAAEIDHLNVGIPPPLRVAIHVFGDKDHVSLGNLQLFTQINVGAASAQNHSQAGFAAVAVAAAKVIVLKRVPRGGKIGYENAVVFHGLLLP